MFAYPEIHTEGVGSNSVWRICLSNCSDMQTVTVDCILGSSSCMSPSHVFYQNMQQPRGITGLSLRFQVAG